MTKTFFTADQHLGHANIIRYCNRPFKTISDMDEYYIEKWNSVVGNSDTVYHLGDFALSTIEEVVRYFSRLRGNVFIIKGNHDHWMKAAQDRFVMGNGHRVIYSPHDIYTVQYDKTGQKIVLSHYPLREWPGYFQGAIHLYGHTHNKGKNMPGSLEVGVDIFPEPVEISQLKDLIVPQCLT